MFCIVIRLCFREFVDVKRKESSSLFVFRNATDHVIDLSYDFDEA